MTDKQAGIGLLDRPHPRQPAAAANMHAGSRPVSQDEWLTEDILCTLRHFRPDVLTGFPGSFHEALVGDEDPR